MVTFYDYVAGNIITNAKWDGLRKKSSKMAVTQ